MSPSARTAGLMSPTSSRPHLPRVLEPGRPLDASRPSQRVELRLVAREEEVPAPAVAGVHAELLLEAHELLAREQREPHVYLGAELGAEPAGRSSRAALSRRQISLQHEYRAASPLREVVGDAGSDHPRADDDGLGRPHALPDRVASMFNLT